VSRRPAPNSAVKPPSSLAELSPERSAQGVAVLATALQAMVNAGSPEEAMTLLRQAARLVPDIWDAPEAQAALRLGMQLGLRDLAQQQQRDGKTSCLDCGTAIERVGERGVLPKRCESCRTIRRRKQKARAVADLRARRRAAASAQ
jgi:hypothetical protein